MEKSMQNTYRKKQGSYKYTCSFWNHKELWASV